MNTSGRRTKKRGVGRKRDLSSRVTSAQLYIEDEREFDKALGQKKVTPAELLRQIVRDWATQRRLEADAQSDTERSVRRVHERIVSEQVTPVLKGVQKLGEKLSEINEKIGHLNGHQRTSEPSQLPAGDVSMINVEAMLEQIIAELAESRREVSKVASASSQQGEQLTLQEAFLKRLMAVCRAQYLLSGQIFASEWASLDFLQRFLTEPQLKESESDPVQTATVQRDAARKEGLELVASMSKEFQLPAAFPLVLYKPAEPDGNVL